MRKHLSTVGKKNSLFIQRDSAQNQAQGGHSICLHWLHLPATKEASKSDANHLNWLLLMWRSSDFTFSPSQMSFTPQVPHRGSSFPLFVSAVWLFWSLPKAHGRGWGFGHIFTSTSRAFLSSSSMFSLESKIAAFTL